MTPELEAALVRAMAAQRAWFDLPDVGEDAGLERVAELAEQNADALGELVQAWEAAAGAVHGDPDTHAAFGSACASAARMAQMDRAAWRRIADEAAAQVTAREEGTE